MLSIGIIAGVVLVVASGMGYLIWNAFKDDDFTDDD